MGAGNSSKAAQRASEQAFKSVTTNAPKLQPQPPQPRQPQQQHQQPQHQQQQQRAADVHNFAEDFPSGTKEYDKAMDKLVQSIESDVTEKNPVPSTHEKPQNRGSNTFQERQDTIDVPTLLNAKKMFHLWQLRDEKPHFTAKEFEIYLQKTFQSTVTAEQIEKLFEHYQLPFVYRNERGVVGDWKVPPDYKAILYGHVLSEQIKAKKEVIRRQAALEKEAHQASSNRIDEKAEMTTKKR